MPVSLCCLPICFFSLDSMQSSLYIADGWWRNIWQIWSARLPCMHSTLPAETAHSQHPRLTVVTRSRRWQSGKAFLAHGQHKTEGPSYGNRAHVIMDYTPQL